MSQSTFLDMPVLPPGVTRFWLIRHALVEQNARLTLYGSLDVPLCPDTLVAQAPMYEALARRLPRDARWIVTPLSRTHRTAQAIQEAGYGAADWTVEPGFIEQSMGELHGLEYDTLHRHLRLPPEPFWPINAAEAPAGGESMEQVCGRVAETLDRLADAHDGHDIVAITHGGTIRAACAHALGISAAASLRLSVQNLSVTILERHPAGWRVVTINELPGI
ncbi:histidine phosphatase family protein [Rhizosaccharibacter radicis]|uniref:Histidine phosphatase family protein n=1 Tax=Rhizosaccharibacter radicis TaxID=2782605 RepID=A0ABT1VSZ4_9PROT|nr:histidine phosphatase family protein [Acetobacteraceae bacterium KSS12]